MHWRRKWRPTPVFLPGEPQGRGAWWAAVCGVAQGRTRLSGSRPATAASCSRIARPVSWVGSRWGSLLPSTCPSGPLRSFWRPHPFPVQLGPASRDPFPQSLSCWPHLRLALLCPGPPGCLCPVPQLLWEQVRAAQLPLGAPQSFPWPWPEPVFPPRGPCSFFFPTFFFKAQLILTSS